MGLGFVPSVKRGQHYDLAKSAVARLKTVDLHIKGRAERDFENYIIAHLKASRALKDELITQVGVGEEKILRANLLGFDHKPDASLGGDGTAIEIKLVSDAKSSREILGQAMAYRMYYRFVVLVLIDQTSDQRVVNLCKDKSSQEYYLLTGLAEEMSVFSVICPLSPERNLVFTD